MLKFDFQNLVSVAVMLVAVVLLIAAGIYGYDHFVKKA